jgi:Kef-type K+ transport system membrane component KefB
VAIRSIFLSLVLILLFARIFGEAAAWLKIPPVMGEMFAGILLGPSLFGWVEPNEIIQKLAEIGLILLLFEVGLDTDLSRLAKRGYKASVVAIVGFVGPGVAVSGACTFCLPGGYHRFPAGRAGRTPGRFGDRRRPHSTGRERKRSRKRV